MNLLILNLYNEAKEKYKNSYRPNNYIPGYIKKRVDTKITNAEIHKLIFQDNKDVYCVVCGSLIMYKKFSYVVKICSNKCAHSTEEYKEKISKAVKGKSKKTKGKTYEEIYGTSNPACGFKKGDKNIAKNPEIRKKISEGVTKSYTEELRKQRSEQAYNGGFIGGNYRKTIEDNHGNRFRSKLEASFSNLLIENDIDYIYEQRVQLINGKIKIVDFVVDNIFIEITGYAYESWQEDLQMKIKWLKESIDENDFIFLITYSDKKEKLFFDSSRNKIGTNIFIFDMDELENIICKIDFVKEITYMNRRLKCIN